MFPYPNRFTPQMYYDVQLVCSTVPLIFKTKVLLPKLKNVIHVWRIVNLFIQILNTTEKIFYCGKLYPRKGTRMIDENAEDPRVNQFRQNRNVSMQL